MDHVCKYYPTIMDGPVIRFRFGLYRGPRRDMFSGEDEPGYAAEISASRNGVSMGGDYFPTYSSREGIDGLKQLLEWAWDAHRVIGERGDHDAAKEWVRMHNMSLSEVRGHAAATIEG